MLSREDIKDKVRRSLVEHEEYDVKNFYHTKGLWQRIARHPLFEAIALKVVALNIIWMGVETDHNTTGCTATGHIVFPVVENLFCAVFLAEWFIRFRAFKRKRDGLRDSWFVFETAMVSLMALETWVMPLLLCGTGAGHVGILRFARLLRLTRVARIAAIFHAVPELLILVKGMMAAVRSVGSTLLLLLILVYVFALVFRQLVPASSIAGQLYFSSMSSSMYTLVLHGIFLDSIGAVVSALAEQSLVAVVLFWAFVLISSLTAMNMLIAVLCQAVSAVAAAEKEAMMVTHTKEQMREFFMEVDTSGDGLISQDEFLAVLSNPKAIKILDGVGVDVIALVDTADALFASESIRAGVPKRQLGFDELVELVLSLRGNCTATAKDIFELRKFTSTAVSHTSDQLRRIETDLALGHERLLAMDAKLSQLEGAPGAGRFMPGDGVTSDMDGVELGVLREGKFVPRNGTAGHSRRAGFGMPRGGKFAPRNGAAGESDRAELGMLHDVEFAP